MLIQLQSFGYKNHIPDDSDFVFDVRCLKNPFWNKELRKLSGKDKKVISFIEADKSSLEMLKGSQVDFAQELIGSSFKISNPKTKSSCGCGVSFSF